MEKNLFCKIIFFFNKNKNLSRINENNCSLLLTVWNETIIPVRNNTVINDIEKTECIGEIQISLSNLGNEKNEKFYNFYFKRTK